MQYINVPLTTQYRGSRYEVEPELDNLPFLHAAETISNVQGIGAFPDPRFLRRLGALPSEKFEAVKAAIRFALDL